MTRGRARTSTGIVTSWPGIVYGVTARLIALPRLQTRARPLPGAWARGSHCLASARRSIASNDSKPGGPAPQRRLGDDPAERASTIAAASRSPSSASRSRPASRAEPASDGVGASSASPRPPGRARSTRPCGQLVRVQQREAPGVMPSTSDVGALLVLLDLLPVPHHVRGGQGPPGRVAEHVRMAADELVVHARATSAIVERAGFLGEHRVEDHLVEEIAELVVERACTSPDASPARVRRAAAPRPPPPPRTPLRAGTRVREWWVCSASRGIRRGARRSRAGTAATALRGGRATPASTSRR